MVLVACDEVEIVEERGLEGSWLRRRETEAQINILRSSSRVRHHAFPPSEGSSIFQEYHRLQDRLSARWPLRDFYSVRSVERPSLKGS